MYALILYDHDGLIDIIDTSPYTELFKVADKRKVQWDGKQYDAEILSLSGNYT